MLPLIDISPVFSNDVSAKKKVAQKIDNICRETGFFLITGHGIEIELISSMYAMQDQFFRLSTQEKMKYKPNRKAADTFKDTCPAGYTPLGSENVYAIMGKEGPNDLVEKISADAAVLQDVPLSWLSNSPYDQTIQRTMKAYFQRLQNLGRILSKLFAIAVDIPENFFIDKMHHSLDMLQCLRYPAFQNAAENSGIAPHTDFSLLSIVSQNQNGLEMCDFNGNWQLIHTPSIDTFIVNIGDLMMHWSNDEWVSTQHRVLLSDKPRASVAFFTLVDDDTLIDCFPKFCEQRPARYRPVTYAQYASQKMNLLHSNSR